MDAAEIAAVRALNSIVKSADSAAEPVVLRARPVLPRRLAVVSGSFNPPTLAHLQLGAAGAAAFDASLAWLLPVQSVDKERVAVLRPADRLLLIDRSTPDGGIFVTNRGLYVDQAATLRAAFPAVPLSFVTGFDKLVQILDPRYYDDRDSALDQLFALADLLVAPRGDDGLEAITRVIGGQSRRWSDHIHPLAVPADFDASASSSAVRAGETVAVPEPVRAFLDAWRPFADDSRYQERWRQIEG